jgi:Tfp pilus assembly protein PilN
MLKFWLSFDSLQRSLLVGSVCAFSTLVGIAILNSQSVQLNKHGLALTRSTAIANQNQLQEALELIKYQQAEIKSIKEQAIAVEQRTKVGGKIVDRLETVEQQSSPDTVADIEATIERSQIILTGDSL